MALRPWGPSGLLTPGKVSSMKTGLRGWNDYELPLVDAADEKVSVDAAYDYFTARLRPDPLKPDD